MYNLKKNPVMPYFFYITLRLESPIASHKVYRYIASYQEKHANFNRFLSILQLRETFFKIKGNLLTFIVYATPYGFRVIYCLQWVK